MGPSQALRLIFDAKPITPREAHARGLVDELLPAETVLSGTQDAAAAIAAKAGRIGVAAAKRAVMTGVEMPLHEAMVLDRALHWDSMRRGGFLAGVESFVAQYG
jgi:enoyl-CoA hydratase/carnithine racemase